MFPQNISGIERILRMAIGLTLLWVVVTGTSGFLLWLGVALGLLLIFTGAVGYDQLYAVLGIDTRDDTPDSSEAQ